MQALAERQIDRFSIRKTPSTRDIFSHICLHDFSESTADMCIDNNAYIIASASTRLKIFHFLLDLSGKAKDILYKLNKFKLLKENWDGNGASKPIFDIINNAINFINDTDEYDLPIYFTAPGPNGEIILEYKNEMASAEIFFEENNVSEMILYRGVTQIYADDINLELLIKHFS